MIRTCIGLTLVLAFGPCQTIKLKPQANDRLVCIRKPWLVPPPKHRGPK